MAENSEGELVGTPHIQTKDPEERQQKEVLPP
jgi:hypothetical protein